MKLKVDLLLVCFGSPCRKGEGNCPGLQLWVRGTALGGRLSFRKPDVSTALARPKSSCTGNFSGLGSFTAFAISEYEEERREIGIKTAEDYLA